MFLDEEDAVGPKVLLEETLENWLMKSTQGMIRLYEGVILPRLHVSAPHIGERFFEEEGGHVEKAFLEAGQPVALLHGRRLDVPEDRIEGQVEAGEAEEIVLFLVADVRMLIDEVLQLSAGDHL